MKVLDGAQSFLDAGDVPIVEPVVQRRHARRSDPDTSQAAAKAAREGEGGPLGRAILQVLTETERLTGHGATAADIQMSLAYLGEAPQQNSVSRRLTTMKDRGYVRDTDERRPSTRRHGHPLIVWASTPEGREWMQHEGAPE